VIRDILDMFKNANQTCSTISVAVNIDQELLKFNAAKKVKFKRKSDYRQYNAVMMRGG